MRFDEHEELDFTIAALCHDLGHTAFSHALEGVLLPKGLRNHEECTLLLLSEASHFGEASIFGQVTKYADVEAVRFLLSGIHSNKSLSGLISSSFDVDRCDYIVRDSLMSGVKYGSYDFSWLLHATAVELNSLGQPVLLLDGPRGISALTQFLRARRDLHAQVYFHPTVRSAQILLKAIFSRMQDLGPGGWVADVVPPSLRSSVTDDISIGDFISTTDVEVHHLVKCLAGRQDIDQTLSYLANMLMTRNLPKSVIDSNKEPKSIYHQYSIVPDVDNRQSTLIEESTIVDLLEDLRGFVARRLTATGQPKEAARYIVAYDPVVFRSGAPTDMLFAFGDQTVGIDDVDSADLAKGDEIFTIERVFVPRDFVSEAREYVRERYRLQ